MTFSQTICNKSIQFSTQSWTVPSVKLTRMAPVLKGLIKSEATFLQNSCNCCRTVKLSGYRSLRYLLAFCTYSYLVYRIICTESCYCHLCVLALQCGTCLKHWQRPLLCGYCFFAKYEGDSKIIHNVDTCCAVGYTALSMRKEPDAFGSFLMLNACATILEPLEPFIDHLLRHDTVPILHWYPMHFCTWYTFSS
jgi:hypothetical protein